MPLQNLVKVRPSEMTRPFQARQSRVRRRFSPIAVEKVPEDVGGDVLALGCDVRVDVELEIAVRRQRAGAVDRAIQKLAEPKQIVLLADGPVEIDSSFWGGVFFW